MLTKSKPLPKCKSKQPRQVHSNKNLLQIWYMLKLSSASENASRQNWICRNTKQVKIDHITPVTNIGTAPWI